MINVHRLGFRSTHFALACILAAATWSPHASAQTPYTASWTSLDTHNPAPEWFQDAKFGIYFHWGAFGVPMFGSEWYPRNMFDLADNSAEYQHQIATYGDPYGSWGYDKFLTGANDKSGTFTQFAPKLVSAGGSWDPDAWAQMFVDAGARFAGPVAEHHDGFSMWDSKVNEWNSVAMGPKLNLAQLHADAIRRKGLRLFMSLHTEWNFGGYWAYGPTQQSDPSLQKLYGQLPNDVEQTLWLNELKEVIDEFLPDILYQDRYLGAISDANLTTFLAYYYNAALNANKEVVAVGKEGITSPHKGQVFDYERGGPADITTPYWLTDDSVGGQSWSYVIGMTYYTDAQFIGSFVDRVSKGGNMILNVSPLPDGTFPQRQKDILTAFGTFLKQMGTAIYNTRAWTVYGEGPTKLGGGDFTTPTALTSSDVRYTTSKDGDAVYAILGGWPGNGKQVTLTSVTTSGFPLGATGKVWLFGTVGGSATSLAFTQDASGLQVTLPSTQPYTAIAYAIKLTKSGAAPDRTPWLTGETGGSDAGVADAATSDGAGASDSSGGSGNAGSSGSNGLSGSSGTDSGFVSSGSAGGSAGSGQSSSGSTTGSGASAGTGTAGSRTSGAASSSCGCSVPGTRGANAPAVLVLGIASLLGHIRRRRGLSKCSTATRTRGLGGA